MYHFVFDYNSGITFATVMLFISVETEMNTLQQTYLMAWWRYKCVKLHVKSCVFGKVTCSSK